MVLRQVTVFQYTFSTTYTKYP